jgi:hypothetical protein
MPVSLYILHWQPVAYYILLLATILCQPTAVIADISHEVHCTFQQYTTYNNTVVN